MNSNLKKLAGLLNVVVFLAVMGSLLYDFAPTIKRWISGHTLGVACEDAEECRSGLCVGQRMGQSLGNGLPMFRSGPIYHGFCSDTCEAASDCEGSYVCDDDLNACVPAASAALGEPCKGEWDCTEGTCAFEMDVSIGPDGATSQSLKDPTAPGECISDGDAFERRLKLMPDPLGLPF